MAPRLLPDDVQGDTTTDPELFRKAGNRPPFVEQMSYFTNLFICQFRSAVTFALWRRTEPAPHQLIFTSRSPSHVGQSVIGRVVIFVKRLHSARARADERFQDEAVNETVKSFPIPPQLYFQIPIC